MATDVIAQACNSTDKTAVAMHEEQSFALNPILNSPYEYPSRHWEMDADNQLQEMGTVYQDLVTGKYYVIEGQ